MIMKKNKGFTLIELLIVVAIIGLLATLAIIGLTTAQQRARDTKRVNDLRAIQSALELYWNDNAKYVVLNNASGSDVNTWTEFGTTLNAYISQMPTDPYHNNSSLGDTYVYTYIADHASATAPDQYYIATVLENTTHQGLTQDEDGASLGGANWRSLDSKDNYTGSAATLDCSDPVYCLSGDASN